MDILASPEDFFFTFNLFEDTRKTRIRFRLKIRFRFKIRVDFRHEGQIVNL